MIQTPPHSLATENALIGCALLDRDSFAIAKGIVRPSEFYGPATAHLWAVCGLLFDRNQPIDLVTIRDELVRTSKLEAIGGDAALLDFMNHAIDTRSAETYARTVRDQAKHRQLITVCAGLAARGYTAESYDEYRGEAERSIRDVTTAEADGELAHVRDVLLDVMAHTQETKRLGKGAITGSSTGIRKLDEQMSGWNRGRLYIVGGRPGMGKSAFTSATILATKDSEPAAVFSIEMPNRENGQRLLAAEIGMDLRDLAQAKISNDGWRDLARACERMNKMPVFLDERTRTLDQIVSKSRRFKAKHGAIGPIIIDYLQLIRGDKRLPREQQISETTRELKALAKELDCAVVCLSQLNRECEKRPDKRPQIADLRESGAIEQDADGIIFLYRRGYYAAQMAKETKPRGRGKSWEPECDIVPGEDDGITEFIVAKMRGGPTGTVKALFQNASARFVDLETDRGPMPVPARGVHDYGS
jgi:replicative DNA helicase